MKCPSSERQLLALLGRLADDEARAITRHARTCLPCLRRARLSSRVISMLAAPPPYVRSAGELTRRIMEACDDDACAAVAQASPAEERGIGARATGTSARSIMAAAAVALAVLGAGAFGGPTRERPRSLTEQTSAQWEASSRGLEPRQAASPPHDQSGLQPAPGALELTVALERQAALYVLRAEYERAESLYEHSLAIKEQTLGTDAPAVAESLDQLAALYLRQHRYVQAEPLFRRSLAIKTKRLGPDHPAVMSALDSLQVLLSLTTQA